MQVMMRGIRSYTSQRLTLFPWLVLPVFILVMTQGQGQASPWHMLAWLGAAVLFFRVFDDLFCVEFDRLAAKPHDYLKTEQTPVIVLAVALAAILCICSAALFGTGVLLVVLTLAAVQIPLYLLLRRSESIAFVSLLKYPVLFFVATSLDAPNPWIWPALGCLFFLVREFLEEAFGRRSVPIEVLVAVTLVATKLITTS